MADFAHTGDDGVHMVDVTEKDDVDRAASASGVIDLDPSTIAALEQERTAKQDVLATARVAAIDAVKHTWEAIPMCHQVPVTSVDVTFDVGDDAVVCRVTVRSRGPTGVEMEALHGVTAGLLTVWDMVKSEEKGEDGGYPTTRIRDVAVEEKRKEEP